MSEITTKVVHSAVGQEWLVQVERESVIPVEGMKASAKTTVKAMRSGKEQTNQAADDALADVLERFGVKDIIIKNEGEK